jgi:hypothetical protein
MSASSSVEQRAVDVSTDWTMSACVPSTTGWRSTNSPGTSDLIAWTTTSLTYRERENEMTIKINDKEHGNDI